MVHRKILVLDLDETLIHSHHDGLVRPTVKPGTPPDFILRVWFQINIQNENNEPIVWDFFYFQVEIDRHPVRFYVYKRPHVDYFLNVVSKAFSNISEAKNFILSSFFIAKVSQWYDLVVFTASMEIYGAAVADKLDNRRGILARRYYRQVMKID